jgi:hypothetical protein
VTLHGRLVSASRRRSYFYDTAFSVFAAALAGCSPVTSPSTSAGAAAGTAIHGAALGPAATIQELMATQVDPSADLLWASVSTVITAAGTQEKQPRTEAEWQTVRRYAVTVVESANLLAVPERRVAASGGKTEDSAIPGIERPENIQKAIDVDPASFVNAALRLRDAGLKAVTAIDQRNAPGLVEAGGDLDSACEACHLKYWYPHSPRPQ